MIAPRSGSRSPPTGASRSPAGGPGADLLTGPRNGIGSATLDGASPASGLLDGGPGRDVLDAYRNGDPALAPPVDILLDGLADDGPPGENDNIVAVEGFDVGSVRTFAGDDADNTFFAPEKGMPTRLSGGGGNDTLTATDAHGDAVDGGPGDDTLSGGFGDDTIVGGPGRDQIVGDRPARCNEPHCDFMDGFGNDTIDARDGEADSVQCGPGVDSVKADPVDRVADDCERVDGAVPGGAAGARPGPGSGPALGPGAGGRPGRRATLVLLGSRRISSVLRHGLRVRVSGPRRVMVRALLGRVLVARGSGRTTVTLRLTAAGRRRLRHTRRATLELVAGAARVRVTLTG